MTGPSVVFSLEYTLPLFLNENRYTKHHSLQQLEESPGLTTIIHSISHISLLYIFPTFPTPRSLSDFTLFHVLYDFLFFFYIFLCTPFALNLLSHFSSLYLFMTQETICSFLKLLGGSKDTFTQRYVVPRLNCTFLC